MRKILVNASAAKLGGALTILETFIDYAKSLDNFYFIILSPLKKENTTNINYVYKKTDGINTFMFSAFGIYKLKIKYDIDYIFSLNNINYILSKGKGITYFHQPKALDKSYKEIKLIIYRFFIKTFLRKNKFIVQSKHIEKQFIKTFPDIPNVISCWPGFSIPENKESSIEGKLNSLFKIKEHTLGFLPISYTAEHKNVFFLNKLEHFFEQKKIKIITLLTNDIFPNKDVFINIGSVKRNDMFFIYSKVDFLLFTSKSETVGLPIFEFLSTGKSTFVFRAPYSEDYFEQFNKPANFLLFKDEKDFVELFNRHLKESRVHNKEYDYSIGEWDKVLN